MNRIRELRAARGWTTEHLAKLANTSQVQISRLETGQRRLTVDWMNRIAAALQVTPADLLPLRMTQQQTDDIGPPGVGYASVAAALSRKNWQLYTVLTDAVIDSGIKPGDTITVDETPDAIEAAKDGDIAIVDVRQAGTTLARARLLRQIVRPRILITNRPGVPAVMTIDDPSLEITVTGIVIRE